MFQGSATLIRRWEGCEEPRQAKEDDHVNRFFARAPPSSAYDGFVFPNGQIATTRLTKYTSKLRITSKLRHMKIIPQFRKRKERGGTRVYIDINFEHTNPESIDWLPKSTNQFLILNYRSCAVTYKPPPTACRRSKTFNTLEFLITLSEVWEQFIWGDRKSLQSRANPNWLKYVPHSRSCSGGGWLVKLSESILSFCFVWQPVPSCHLQKIHLDKNIWKYIPIDVSPSSPHTS